MKNILVLTDFSENAWNSLKYAIKLFNNNSCNFHFLNTYTPNIASYRLMTTNLNNGQIKNDAAYISKTELKKLKKYIDENWSNPKHTFSYTSSFSLLKDEAKEIIEKENIDFIAMGAKGVSDTEEVSMGNNTIRIIKSIKNCPLLIIPKHSDFRMFNTITFITDFNHFYKPSELSMLLTIAKMHEVNVEIICNQDKSEKLTEQQRYNLEALKKYLDNIKFEIQIPSEGNSFTSIEKQIDNSNHHLIVVPDRLLNFIQESYRLPSIKKELFDLKTPLLIIPETKISLPKKHINQDVLSH
ncbi:universal stress protein [Flavobacteriaceae bacterium R38]|nr:universal stress protein [Flavobacteriaceae bacterium R38]